MKFNIFTIFFIFSSMVIAKPQSIEVQLLKKTSNSCATYFGGRKVMNEMTATAVTSNSRLFEEVNSISTSGYNYTDLPAEPCEFRFRFRIDVDMNFKDISECTMHASVEQTVLYFDVVEGMATKSKIEESQIDLKEPTCP